MWVYVCQVQSVAYSRHSIFVHRINEWMVYMCQVQSMAYSRHSINCCAQNKWMNVLPTCTISFKVYNNSEVGTIIIQMEKLRLMEAKWLVKAYPLFQNRRHMSPFSDQNHFSANQGLTMTCRALHNLVFALKSLIHGSLPWLLHFKLQYLCTWPPPWFIFHHSNYSSPMIIHILSFFVCWLSASSQGNANLWSKNCLFCSLWYSLASQKMPSQWMIVEWMNEPS